MNMQNDQKSVMKSRINSLNTQVERVKDELARLNESKKEFAGYYAPLRPGAIIAIPEEAYVHQGKNGKVEECVLKHSAWDSSWRWLIIGIVLKENSEEGIHRFQYEKEVDLA